MHIFNRQPGKRWSCPVGERWRYVGNRSAHRALLCDLALIVSEHSKTTSHHHRRQNRQKMESSGGQHVAPCSKKQSVTLDSGAHDESLTLSSPTSFLSRLLPLQTCGRKASGKDVSETDVTSDDAVTAGTPVTRYRRPCSFSSLSPSFTVAQIMKTLVILVILNGDTLNPNADLLRVILLHMSHFYYFISYNSN